MPEPSAGFVSRQISESIAVKQALLADRDPDKALHGPFAAGLDRFGSPLQVS